MMNNDTNGRTIAGTDIEEVKRKNAQSGMSYNEVKAFIAQTTGGHDTAKYSDTNTHEIKKKNDPTSK